MGLPDFDSAMQYALQRLEEELNPTLIYHSAGHTRNDVMPAVERLAQIAGVNGMDLSLLMTAAAFHDVGYVIRQDGHNHEVASVNIAREVLPSYGFTAQQIDIIASMIMATKVPQQPA